MKIVHYPANCPYIVVWSANQVHEARDSFIRKLRFHFLVQDAADFGYTVNDQGNEITILPNLV